MQKEAKPADLANFVRHLSEDHVFPNKVLVDCTADTNVASHYYDWLKKGIHVITPNKKANSGPLDRVNVWLAKHISMPFVFEIIFKLFNVHGLYIN